MGGGSLSLFTFNVLAIKNGLCGPCFTWAEECVFLGYLSRKLLSFILTIFYETKKIKTKERLLKKKRKVKRRKLLFPLIFVYVYRVDLVCVCVCVFGLVGQMFDRIR